MTEGRVSMRTVARAAGVAVSTVSRALTDPDRINPETRELVLKAVAEVGYVAAPGRPEPNPGRGLIAMVIPDITNVFYGEMVAGARELARDSGYVQLVVDLDGSADQERRAFEWLPQAVAGAILTASRYTDQEVSDLAEQLPLVAFNRRVPRVPSVSLDTPSVFGDAVRHLADLGHEEICFVSGPQPSLMGRRRWDATQDAAEALGLSVTRLGPFMPWNRSGATAADVMLESSATAAIAYNDTLALQMWQRFTERGVRVPEEISIVGCDDIVGDAFYAPALTSVSGDIALVGRELTAQLITLLDGRMPEGDDLHRDLPVHLRVRGSTGPARPRSPWPQS